MKTWAQKYADETRNGIISPTVEEDGVIIPAAVSAAQYDANREVCDQALRRAFYALQKTLDVSYDPQWVPLQFVNGWQHYSDAAYGGDAAYRIDPFGVVHLRGMISSGSAAAKISNVPRGPGKKSRFLAACSGSAAYIDLYPGGDIVHAGYLTLGNFRFTFRH